MKKRTKKKAVRRKVRKKFTAKRHNHLKMCVRFLQTMMQLRIAVDNSSRELMTRTDERLFDEVGTQLEKYEKRANDVILRALKGVPIWEQFLKKVIGIGPRIAGPLVAETDIRKCNTPSKLWSWWGLAVIDGQAAPDGYDPRRKSRMVQIAAESFIKQQTYPYAQVYHDYKEKKQKEMVEECMGCAGTGERAKPYKTDGSTECHNCNGTGGPAPWGRSQAHRHRAAVRVMMKRFLLDFWKAWRELEGLPVGESYHERE